MSIKRPISTADHVIEVEGLPVTDRRPNGDRPGLVDAGSDDRANRRPSRHKGQATVDEVCDEVIELARHGKPGMKMHAQVLEVRAGASFMGESQLEMMGPAADPGMGLPRT